MNQQSSEDPDATPASETHGAADPTLVERATRAAGAAPKRGGGTSDAQVEANRRNAERSTGPTTPAGREASSRNAFQHGAYASMPIAIRRGTFAEDEQEVHEFIEGIITALAPRDPLEFEQAQRIAVYYLRLRRVSRLEAHAIASDSRIYPNSTEDEATRLEHTSAWVLGHSVEQVTKIDGRTSQALDRALILYAQLQTREVDTPSVEPE